MYILQKKRTNIHVYMLNSSMIKTKITIVTGAKMTSRREGVMKGGMYLIFLFFDHCFYCDYARDSSSGNNLAYFLEI